MAEFWRDLKPIEGVFKKDAAAEVYLPDGPDGRRALLRAAVRDGEHAAALDLAPEQPLVRHPLRERGGSREPALPPARGLLVHDLGQVELPGARLGRHRRRLRLRGA